MTAQRYSYKPGMFSGDKFAQRYGISSLDGDFWADKDFIYLRDGLILPDDPPIFEPPDPPRPSLASRIEALPGQAVSPVLREILLELAKGR